MANNYSDVLQQLQAAGLELSEIEIGRMVRCRAGDREKRGWYILHEIHKPDGSGSLICGSYGIWHGNDNGAQKVTLTKSAISADQLAAVRNRIALDKKRVDRARKIEATRAAERARKVWKRCDPTGESEYLARKGVTGLGVRYSPSGALVIPVMDTGHKIHGLQVIRPPKRESRRLRKEFWPQGMAKRSHFHLIGLPQESVLVVEGYATGASIHAATSLPVAVAFDAGNLAPVGAALRAKYKRLRILFCADDDAFGDVNTGVIAASSAALEVDGSWLKPIFSDEVARREAYAKHGRKLSDFNDLHMEDGLHAVTAQIASRLGELGWSVAKGKSRSPAQGGRGKGEISLESIESVDELLDRFALVYGQGGAVFDRQEHQLVALSDMRDACSVREIPRAWQEHPEREIVRMREVGFDPAGEDAQIKCNLWRGWPTESRAGTCERMLDLLRYLCSNEHDTEKVYQWVLRWIAYPIQHPGAKMKTALVVHGKQGTGKNMFFEALMAIYGSYGKIINQDAIEDRFNDWASRKLFLIADEVVARSDLYHVKNKLKAFITGDWIRINCKQIAAYDERNHVNMVFLSNMDMPVALDEDDRRHMVIWTPPTKPDTYYHDISKERDAGGIAALHDYLLHLDLGDFHPDAKPPLTDAKATLIGLGLDSTTRFFYELTQGDLGTIQCRPALSTDVYDLYKLWCGRSGHHPAPLPKLVNALSRRHGVDDVRRRYLTASGKERGPHGVLMLPSEEMPVGNSEKRWLGEQIDAFRMSVDDYKGANVYA